MKNMTRQEFVASLRRYKLMATLQSLRMLKLFHAYNQIGKDTYAWHFCFRFIYNFAIQLALNKHAWFYGAGRAVDSLGVLLFTGVSPGEYFISSFT